MRKDLSSSVPWNRSIEVTPMAYRSNLSQTSNSKWYKSNLFIYPHNTASEYIFSLIFSQGFDILKYESFFPRVRLTISEAEIKIEHIAKADIKWTKLNLIFIVMIGL